MRNLFILRGAPASGKSTWIKDNHLEQYTLSTDNIRLMYQSPVTNEFGERVISQNNDSAVWKLLYDILEKRMERGEFIIIDATHYKSSLISSYKKLVDKYRYRVNVVDFSDVSEEECIRRNAQRDAFRKVPEEVIRKMYACIRDDSEVKNAYKIISRDEAAKILNSPLEPVKIDESVSKVVIFGDIHGCYTPLKEYFDKNPFRDDYCYIFCGDYLDRGLENKEVLEFLLSIYEKKNVFLLEGNHEQWLKIYSSKDYKPFERKKLSYSDYYVERITYQLDEKIKQLNNKINKEQHRLNELNSLEGEEVFFEFENVNKRDTQKAISEKIGKMKEACEVAKHYIYVLRHEKNNTSATVTLCKLWFEETFDEGLSFNIRNLVGTELGMEEIKEDNPIRSSEFIQNTLPQIQSISREDIRKLCRKFIQMSYFDFCGARFLVTHGGLPCLPDIFTPTKEMIKGVGKYDDHEFVDKMFNEKTLDAWQIHGHRNTLKVPTYDGVRTFNLEGEVEFGGNLRIVELSKTEDGWEHTVMEIPNPVYKKEEIVEEKTDLQVLKEMLYSPLINVAELSDNIISINFNKDAFFNDKWNDLTCRARGLFVDKTNGNIVARSFNKFFNYGQVPETKIAYMKEHMKFPSVGYLKENGFLGIVSKYQDKVRIFTKSRDDSMFTNMFIGMLCNHFGIICNTNMYLGRVWGNSYYGVYDQLSALKYFIKTGEDVNKHPFGDWETIKTWDEFDNIITLEENNLKRCKQQLLDRLSSLITEGYSYVFECVDIENDPHIIKYDKSNVYLLEVFKNQLKEEYLPYEDLISISDALQVPLKKRELEFNSWEEFEAWIKEFEKSDDAIEGYVVEDANGFRVKFKSSYYRFWKEMRKIKELIELGRDYRKTYKSKQEIEVIKLLESLGRDKLKTMSIIDVRNLYERYKED